jgi:hypothetical protein
VLKLGEKGFTPPTAKFYSTESNFLKFSDRLCDLFNSKEDTIPKFYYFDAIVFLSAVNQFFTFSLLVLLFHFSTESIILSIFFSVM